MSEIRSLLLTDIVDSTALTERLGERAAAALWLAHDRIARDLLPAWRGLEIDRTDGFLLLFDKPVDALGYALAYQNALHALPVPVQARAGLHVGAVGLRRNESADVARGAKPIEVEGLAKPLAARVMAIAQGGQTLLTRAALDALGNIPIPARIRSQGFWRIKGINEPVELFEAGTDAAPFQPPPDGDKAWRVVAVGDLWLPAREVRHSLPAELDAFIGRRQPLAELACRFDEGARLVSVLGAGGTGKTRLATRFGWAWLGDFPGGVWFCDLSQARSPAGIVSAVAQGLGVPPSQDAPLRQLGAAIAARGHCLVILDNFEQVTAHAAACLGSWLDAAPDAHFLVTTRELLRLPGEQALMLDTLPEPEAIELFERRAHAVNGNPSATAEDQAALGQLMNLLDGLPLAIELAAARTRIMPPRMLLERMRERFRLLTVGSGSRDRQATLRATLDWSWELLGVEEQLALAQLSVFEGSFGLEAAEALIDLAGFAEPPWTTDLVQALVDKSLVRALSDARFDLLLSVRDYASERLRAGGAATEQAARARHCGFYAALGPAASLAHRCADLDNLVAACRWATSSCEPTLAADALEGAWAALRYRGPFSTGLELAEQVAALDGLRDAARARVALVAGSALACAGRESEAQSLFSTALALARQAGARRTEGRALIELSNDALWTGRLDEARAGYASAIELARESGDHDLECSALNGLGMTAEQRGEVDEARLHYERALVLARAAEDRHWEGSVLGNLGSLCAALGQFGEAGRCYERSLTIATELGDRERESNALCNLGLMLYTCGDLPAARGRSEAALTAARDMGNARLECVVLCNLGMVDEAAERPINAERHFRAALELAERLGDRRSSGQILTYLGLLQGRQRGFEAALSSLQSGESALREVSDLPSLALLFSARAEILALSGAVNDAQHALTRAEALAIDLNAGAESELGTALSRVRGLLAPAAAGHATS
jgi:predicted ATPase/Tfp pilus assembly protein PilF